jgi:hypothetical protein
MNIIMLLWWSLGRARVLGIVATPMIFGGCDGGSSARCGAADGKA